MFALRLNGYTWGISILQKAEDLTVAMRKAFLDLDAELRQMDAVKRGDDHSGSTAITTMVTPTHIIAANCGDSRSILVTSEGVKAMSEDHKPYNVSLKRCAMSPLLTHR